MAYTDRELFARLIQSEAGGEGDDGMRAVATVVMNRVHAATGEYQRVCQGDLRKVIFQPGQFDSVATTLRGKYNPQNIYNMNPTSVHYNIADWALGGGVHAPAGTCLWFMNPFKPSCPYEFPYNGSGVHHTRINQHCFYRPTPKYKGT